MHTEELTNYIVGQLQSGINPNDIATQLRNANWPDEAIQSAFAAANQKLTPQPVPSAPEHLQHPGGVGVAEQHQNVQVIPTVGKRGRMKAGWQLFKQTFGIIRSNPALWRYMVMTIAWNIGIVVVLLGVYVIDSQSTSVLSTTVDGENSVTGSGLIVLIVAGYLLTSITYYYATALSVHTLAVFRGQQGSYLESITAARNKLPAILTYAAIATIVGYILQAIEQRFRFIGWIISKVLGLIWSLATTFTLPLIADTNVSGAGSVKQSITLFKQTWGETVTSRISLGALAFLIYFLVMIPLLIALAMLLGSAIGAVGVIIAIALFFIGLILLVTAEALASNVLNVALYYYARYKAIPPSFSAELLSTALISKQKK